MNEMLIYKAKIQLFKKGLGRNGIILTGYNPNLILNLPKELIKREDNYLSFEDSQNKYKNVDATFIINRFIEPGNEGTVFIGILIDTMNQLEIKIGENTNFIIREGGLKVVGCGKIISTIGIRLLEDFIP